MTTAPIPSTDPTLCQTSGLPRRLVEQFHRPHGPLGVVAGWIMTWRASNRERNAWTVDLLDVQPDDRLLEVGFGPGLAIERAAARATHGFVAGIDHSTVMLRLARRRNRRAIAEGRVDLRLASADAIVDFGRSFDKLFAVNVVHFSAAPQARLKAWRGLLRPGGQIALTFQPPSPRATEADALAAGERLVAALGETGFTNARLERLPLRRVMAVCALARRPWDD